MGLLAGALHAAPLTRARAIQALGQAEAAVRLAGVDRLAEIGRGRDADRVAVLLADPDPQVREAAQTAMWLIWSRSGDPAIDALFIDGVAQMQAGALDDALATFDGIVRRKPAFAEGWNKRATVLFMLGRNEESLRDCGEVFKRSSTGPWTPFGGVTLTGAEDILVVPSANGAELQILVAAGDGVYIAENVPDRPL